MRANLISGSLYYNNWGFYSLQGDVILSDFLFSDSAHTLCPNLHSLSTNYWNAQLQPLQTVYLNPTELWLCQHFSFHWLSICIAEKQQMYDPRNPKSLAAWPQWPVDWLPSLILGAGMTEKHQLYDPRSRSCLAGWPQGPVDWLPSSCSARFSALSCLATFIHFQYLFCLARSLLTWDGGFFFNFGCPDFSSEESLIFLSVCLLEAQVEDLFFLRFCFLFGSFSLEETSFLSWWEAVCRPDALFFNGVDSSFLAGNLVTRVK